MHEPKASSAWPHKKADAKAPRQLHLACDGTAVTKVISPHSHESMHKRETWRSPQAVCVMLVVGHLISTISFALIMEVGHTSHVSAHALVGQCPEHDECMFAAIGA